MLAPVLESSKADKGMESLRFYIDDSNDLWVFFADSASYIGGPFLYCFDSKSLKFKKGIRLYSDKGTPVCSPYDPLFVSHDQNGNFIFATDLAYLTKVDNHGKRIYRKRLMEYDKHWTTRNKERKRPYFVRDIDKQGDHNRKRGDYYGTYSAGSLYMLSVAYSKSRDLIFVGQDCRCDPNDVIVYNGAGKYLYHFGAPAGPSAIVARDGLLYLADHYFSFIHVFTYEGQWVRSIDMLMENRFDGLYYLENGQLKRRWEYDEQYEAEDKYCIASMCALGEDNLAIGMEGGLVRVLDQDGRLICNIEPPKPGLYPNSMAGDSSDNLFVFYTRDFLFRKPHGLYRYGAGGKTRGPLFTGEMGMFTPREKDLQEKIAEARADAYDYFQLSDIQIRRKKLSLQTIRLLENSLALKPDLWIALAYLGLSLMELGEIERSVRCMEEASDHLPCAFMAVELIRYYLGKGNKEKVMKYFKAMEENDSEVDVEFYTDKLTTKELERFLGDEVKRTDTATLVSASKGEISLKH